MKKLIALLSLCLATTACVQKLTEDEIKNADYGEYPANYEKIVKDYYEDIAKDPESMKYKKITEPKKLWYRFFNDYYFGYITCVTANGKNSFGAYTGYTTEGLLIKDNKVIRFFKERDLRENNFCLN